MWLAVRLDVLQRWILMLLCSLAFEACLPFALPPGKATVGVGPRHYDGGFRSPETVAGSEVASQFRVGLHPLGLVRELHQRDFDVGVGYSIELPTGEQETDAELPAVLGPFLDLEYFPLHFGDKDQYRLGAIVSPLLITNDAGGFDNGVDYGLDLRFEFEVAGFSEGDPFSSADEDTNIHSDDSTVFGIGYGEWSLGLWVAGGTRSMGDGQSYDAWLGLSGRWPALLGVICCVGFGDDD